MADSRTVRSRLSSDRLPPCRCRSAGCAGVFAGEGPRVVWWNLSARSQRSGLANPYITSDTPKSRIESRLDQVAWSTRLPCQYQRTVMARVPSACHRVNRSGGIGAYQFAMLTHIGGHDEMRNRVLAACASDPKANSCNSCHHTYHHESATTMV